MAKSLDAFAQSKLDDLEAKSLRRRAITVDPLDAVRVRRDGRELINFSSNDYLGFNQRPELKQAAMEATERYGVGSGASRLVTGTHPLFEQLEARLAKLKGTEDCVVLGSGYLTNTGIIPTLAGKSDGIFFDELSHACIHAGAELTRGARHVFRHNDMVHLRELLEQHRSACIRALIVTDGVFSMDGDLAPVSELADLAEEFDAWLMTDDAHGIGVVGAGRGSSYANGGIGRVPLQMGTLSKAIGAYGGYLCASKPVVDLIRTRCRPFIYSTGLPAGTVAAAIAALDLIEGDASLVARPLALAQRFTRALNLPLAESPIVPVILGETERTLSAGQLLIDEGYLVVPIRPPTVPEGTARLRVTFSAAHTDEQVDGLAGVIRQRILERPAP